MGYDEDGAAWWQVEGQRLGGFTKPTGPANPARATFSSGGVSLGCTECHTSERTDIAGQPHKLGCSRRVVDATPLIAADDRTEDDGAPGSIEPASIVLGAALGIFLATAAFALWVLL